MDINSQWADDLLNELKKELEDDDVNLAIEVDDLGVECCDNEDASLCETAKRIVDSIGSAPPLGQFCLLTVLLLSFVVCVIV